MKLLIVSDTALCKRNGQILGFGPVVHETNYFLRRFNKIVWIGYNKPEMASNPSMIPVDNRIDCILLPSTGGPGLLNKLRIIKQLPILIQTILSQLPSSDVVHTRGPSIPAMVAILLSYVSHKPKWWHKYAGNWKQYPLAMSYRFQRYLLQKARNTRVMINGHWPGQAMHLMNWENPCITANQVQEGKEIAYQKVFEKGRYHLCFVGALNKGKGVIPLTEAIQKLDPTLYQSITIIGDGPESQWMKKTLVTRTNIVFTGYLNKNDVANILMKQHFILLPSLSEGFPKVIAEGICYGVLPVVSNISSIGQKINEMNGFLLEHNDTISLLSKLEEALRYPENRLKEMSVNLQKLAPDFTYERYMQRIESEIIQQA